MKSEAEPTPASADSQEQPPPMSRGKQGAAEKKPGKKRQKLEAAIGSRRGVETLFRNSYRAHLDLIALATTKANIMISINGLILSLLFVSEAFVMSAEPLLEIPTGIFLLTCFVSMAFAILAAMPGRRKADWTAADFRQDKASLLAFEDYTALPEGDYMTAMRELLQDSPRVYDQMLKQLYFLGTHANKRLRRLRLSYSVFLIGLGLSILTSFVLLFTFYWQEAAA